MYRIHSISTEFYLLSIIIKNLNFYLYSIFSGTNKIQSFLLIFVWHCWSTNKITVVLYLYSYLSQSLTDFYFLITDFVISFNYCYLLLRFNREQHLGYTFTWMWYLVGSRAEDNKICTLLICIKQKFKVFYSLTKIVGKIFTVVKHKAYDFLSIWNIVFDSIAYNK